MVIYKSNLAGPYHIENGLPCQDSFAIFHSDAISVLAVTDGLGSELYSDIGASVAAQAAVKYCSKRIIKGMDFADIKRVMNNALVSSYKAVLARANEDGNDSDEYDSTLCLAVYYGEHLYFAQSGDSGLVALLENGEYYRVTTQQRDEEGRVFPLCWGPEKWEFGYVDSPVSAFMLMTDGVFEQICPKLMRKRDIEINIPLARRFLDRFDCTEEDVPELEKAVHKYLEHYPRHLLDDDKTVVVLINPERRPAEKDEAYYAIPDWKTMCDEAEKRLLGSDTTIVEEIGDIVDDSLLFVDAISDNLETSVGSIRHDPGNELVVQSDDVEARKNSSHNAEDISELSEDVKKNEQLNTHQNTGATSS